MTRFEHLADLLERYDIAGVWIEEDEDGKSVCFAHPDSPLDHRPRRFLLVETNDHEEVWVTTTDTLDAAVEEAVESLQGEYLWSTDHIFDLDTGKCYKLQLTGRAVLV